MIDKSIDIEKTVDMIKDKPYNLPAGFYWADVDVKDKDQAKEVYDLLT